MITNHRSAQSRSRAVPHGLIVALLLPGLFHAGRAPSRAKAEDAAKAKPAPGAKAPPDVLPADPAERAAAARIRELGGWYELDADRHVVEVNMVYHESLSGEREENPEKSDEALAEVVHFPHLKRLYLCEDQASDEGLEFVGRLAELEELILWEAGEVTDEGVAHLQSLPKLKFLKLGGTGITDKAVAHLSKISSLEVLYLDDNFLTDDALEHASKLPRLRELALENAAPDGKENWITAEGLAHVRKMPALERLGIPFRPVGDQDLKPLHGLKTLKLLEIENVLFDGRINEAAVFELQKTIPDLKVEADGKVYPPLRRIVDAQDPEQQKIDRREGLEGLKTIERFLELVAAERDAEALQLTDRGTIGELRRYSKKAEKPLKVSAAQGEREAVLATTEPVTVDIHELVDDERQVVGEQITRLTIGAIKTDGAWRVRTIGFEGEEPEKRLQWFKANYPCAQDLLQPAVKAVPREKEGK